MPDSASARPHTPAAVQVITVTLNPAIDRTVSIPHFAAGEVNRVEHSTDKAGGKGVNVAIALALAGAQTAATGLLGSANRSIFADTFARLGIEDRFTLLEGETRIGIKIVDPVSGDTTDINFPGLRPDKAALLSVRNGLLEAAQRNATAANPLWVALSGSLPPEADPALYATWITDLKNAGARVLLDASGPALEHGIVAAPAVIKPNQDELQALLGTKLSGTAEIATAARELAGTHGIDLVVVSMGADGACLVSTDAAVHIRPVRIPIYSTVGAGDAMVAGLLHALCQTGNNAPTHSYDTQELARIGRSGTAFSLATLQQPQTQCAETFRTRLQHWLPQISVETVGPRGLKV